MAHQLLLYGCDNTGCPRGPIEGRVYLGCGFRGIEVIVERSVATASRHGAGTEAHRSLTRMKQRE